MTPKEISAAVQALYDQIEEAEASLAVIQAMCTHPNLITKVGTYAEGNIVWKDYSCPDCTDGWMEEA